MSDHELDDLSLVETPTAGVEQFQGNSSQHSEQLPTAAGESDSNHHAGKQHKGLQVH